MTIYRGNLDGILRGKLSGWAVNARDLDDKPNIVVLINGSVAAVTRANALRSDLRELNIGDGSHGFEVNLTPFLAGILEPAEIDVLVGNSGWALPGSPVRYVVPANGYLDY